MRFSKSKTQLPKYMINKARRVNKLIDQWEAAGLTTNDLEQAKVLLEKFYTDADKTVKDPDRASEKIRLSKRDKEEYNNLLNYILYDDNLDISKRTLKNQAIRAEWDDPKYEQAYETTKSIYKGVIKDEQDYINFIDRMNRYSNNRVVSAYLSSKQIADIHNKALASKDTGYTEGQINRMIIKAAEKDGLAGDYLHGRIIELIEAGYHPEPIPRKKTAKPKRRKRK